MKRYKRWILLLIIGAAWMFVQTYNVHAAGSLPPYIAVNDNVIDFGNAPPEAHSNNIYVAARVIANAMQIDLRLEDNQVLLEKGGTKLIINPGEKYAVSVTGEIIRLQTYTRHDRLMIPLSLITTSFGYRHVLYSEAPIIRAKNNDAELSDEQFLKQERRLVEQSRLAAIEAARKPIYLTFDDGPTGSTPKLLDILGKYKAKATFFLLGNGIIKYPESVKRLVKEGHRPALHGVTHVKDKFYESPSSAYLEMEHANKYLLSASGVKSTLIRTPYGSKPYFTDKYRDATAAAGYHLWDWNVDSKDWEYRTDSGKMIRHVMSEVAAIQKEGEAPVVLLHDRPTTIAAMPSLLARLHDAGYRFEPLRSDMMPVNFWQDLR
ncbi:polysaccharide deacetylase [Paenibacillus harenae]|uniref:polysaccharide deacetylase n=1 Tax=Paenibacillus harenae TaxID=306543 RepID=UPI002791E7CB|nr:polysaccharide deacetylase [Paenibacillus harenae]MDQ0058092.1 peptidoglycan/xylan/chitin deacetylase (PgdA/CDA1 family) [Paenibacillus harenae]